MALKYLSTATSILSFTSFLVALLPQQIHNYQLKSVHGISIYMLFFLFCADLCNFLGCVLTDQLPFQFYNSCYALTNDSILFFQYWLYRKNKQNFPLAKQHQNISNIDAIVQNDGVDPYYPENTEENEGMLNSVLSIGSNLSISNNMIASTSSIFALASQISHTSAYPIGHLMTTSSKDKLDEEARDFGYLVAYTCAFFYTICRIPQIVKLHKNKSVLGFSLGFTILAISGNVFYISSILLTAIFDIEDTSNANSKILFLWNELPYMVGNIGSILMDIVIICQYIHYSNLDKLHLELQNKQLKKLIDGVPDDLSESDDVSPDENSRLLGNDESEYAL